MTTRQVVLTLIGHDRPGIVAQLADTIVDAGGNWEQSELARLADRFAGVMLVSIPTSSLDDFKSAIADLGSDGPGDISIQFSLSEADDAHQEADDTTNLELTATDRKGIVQEVANALSLASSNVEMLRTNITDTPHAGGRLFHASFEVVDAEPALLEQLAERLEAIAPDVMVDIS